MTSERWYYEKLMPSGKYAPQRGYGERPSEKSSEGQNNNLRNVQRLGPQHDHLTLAQLESLFNEPVKVLPEACKAVQHSDQMSCELCDLVWDVNDPAPPDCRHPFTEPAPFLGSMQDIPTLNGPVNPDVADWNANEADVQDEEILHQAAFATDRKATNPKDAIGIQKWRVISAVPSGPLLETGMAMTEGLLKYGRHNYRLAGVRASVYYDAAMGHLISWWEGEEIDPDSGLPHIVKAMACLFILRDAQINGMDNDDRPPPTKDWSDFAERLQAIMDGLRRRYPDPPPPVTFKDIP